VPTVQRLHRPALVLRVPCHGDALVVLGQNY